MSFRDALTLIYVASLCVHFASSLPWHGSVRHSTHRRRELAKGLIFETYHPISFFETFGPGVDHPLSKRSDATLNESALSFVHSKLDLKPGDALVHASYEGSSARYAYLRQHIQGIPVANAVANVAFNKDNKVVAFGSSFLQQVPKPPSGIPTIDVQNAIKTAESALGGRHVPDNHPDPSGIQYVLQGGGTLALTHVFQVSNETTGAWFEAFVDAHSGKLLSVTDYVAHATYRALPIQKQDLTEGFEDIVDPEDMASSPLGWHNDGKTVSNTTAGNNALAYKGVQTNVTTESQDNLTFIYTQDTATVPTTPANLDAARVNAFYVVNKMHDVAYRYGFTEAAFNFQTDNFNHSGRGNDRIIVSVQTTPGTDNAYFTAQPDGVNGQIHLYLFDYTSPGRDSALENDIVVHETTHGITNRMTGGGTASCLQSLEAGGLGEGWSDAMAEWTEHSSADIADYVLGAYVTNNPAGVRTHPYSTDTATNPLRYSSVAALDEVHAIGEVWANILHNVYAALVQAHGYSQTALTDPSGTEGNVVFMHLFIDALPLQPCNPTFVNARDAWIQADVNRYAGANKCLLWKVFASRGLGVSAADYVDDLSVPTGC